MSNFVMSDIHGCYDEFISMLDKINFSGSDGLIIAGDYIDRGTKTFEMIKWLENCPSNVTLLRGNHEEQFTEYIKLMQLVDREEELFTDFSSNSDTSALYDSVRYFIRANALEYFDFDLYDTVNDLIGTHNAAFDDLCGWSDMFQKMPYFKKLEINGRTCAAVHAGYTEDPRCIGENYENIEEYYLYAREEGLLGGIPHGMIIFGHTPTIVEEKFAYTGGKVFRYYDEKKDCIFYDIDCGSVFRSINCDAALACIRLEDEKIFYV